MAAPHHPGSLDELHALLPGFDAALLAIARLDQPPRLVPVALPPPPARALESDVRLLVAERTPEGEPLEVPVALGCHRATDGATLALSGWACFERVPPHLAEAALSVPLWLDDSDDAPVALCRIRVERADLFLRGGGRPRSLYRAPAPPPREPPPAGR